MPSYLKYKEYYDRKAKATPLQEKDYCFVLQPKADSQGSKISFRNFRWIGPFVVQKVLPNNSYIVRRLNTNKTQILHRIRLKKIVPNTPLEDKYKEEKLQPDDEIIIPQDDLNNVAWVADFKYELFEPRKDHWLDTATRLPNDAVSGEVDYYVTEHERSNTNSNECSSSEKNENDVIENEKRPRPVSSRDASSPLNESPIGTENENDVTNDVESTEIASNGGADITVPGISENERNEENYSPRGGKYNLRPNPNPNFSDEYRYQSEYSITSPIFLKMPLKDIYFYLGPL